MNHEAIFTIKTPYASLIHSSLVPDEEEMQTRASGSCRIKDHDEILLTVQADDLTALRALINTWLRLAQVASEMAQTTDNIKCRYL